MFVKNLQYTFLYKKLEYPYGIKSFLDFAHFWTKKFLSSFLFLVKIRKKFWVKMGQIILKVKKIHEISQKSF